jgi:hypothetical protein
MESSMTEPQLNRAFHYWQIVAVGSVSLAVLSLASPQVRQLGRGLQTTLPALIVAGFAITRISDRAFSRAFTRFRSAFLFGALFLIQAALRFAYDDDSRRFWDTFVWGPLIALGFLLFIGAYAQLGSDALRKLRSWLLLGWCISLALGLPVLLENVGIAREIMQGRGDFSAAKDAANWAPYGVGTFDTYTILAICLSPLFYATRGFVGVMRVLAFILVCLAATAVVFSTFTMAAVLLALGIFGTLLVWVIAVRRWLRVWRTAVLLASIVVLSLLYSQASLFPQTDFVVSKANRLYRGFTTTGLAKGDETGRGQMFVEEMKAFVDEPFLGYIPHVTGQRGYGHSSLANSLSLFGLFGAALWVAALGTVLKDSLRYTGDSTNRRTLLLCWSGLVLAGILNPIWHTPEVAIIFALTMPARENHVERNLFESIPRRIRRGPSEAPPAGNHLSVA